MESAGALAGRRLGEGERPLEFDRVSWPAFFVPLLWIIANRIWSWLAVLIGFSLLTSLLLGLLEGTWARFFVGSAWLDALASPSAARAAHLALEAASWLLSAFFAVRGNRARWQSDAAVARTPQTAAHYLESQRKWTLPAGIFFAATFLYRATASTPSQDDYAGYALGALVIGALWVWDQSRKANAERLKAS